MCVEVAQRGPRWSAEALDAGAAVNSDASGRRLDHLIGAAQPFEELPAYG